MIQSKLKIRFTLFIIMVVTFVLSVPLSLSSCSNPDDYYKHISSSAKKVTLDELQAFVSDDKTDRNSYVLGSYVCWDFAEDVIEHAKQHNYRVGLVGIDNNIHVLVCFDTTDGLYFLEPQFDLVFPKEKMEEMKSRGIYDLSNGYGFMREYFDYPLSSYYIDWR